MLSTAADVTSTRRSMASAPFQPRAATRKGGGFDAAATVIVASSDGRINHRAGGARRRQLGGRDLEPPRWSADLRPPPETSWSPADRVVAGPSGGRRPIGW